MELNDSAPYGRTRIERERFYRERGLWTDECLGLLPATAASRWPDREFVYCDGRRYTYQEFWRWTLAVAHDLTARGLKPGDHILLQMANGMEVLVLQFAAWRIGAVSIPVVPMFRLRELTTIVDELHPKMIAVSAQVGSRNLADEVEKVVAETGLKPLEMYLVGGGDRSGWRRLPASPEPSTPLDEAGLPSPPPADKCCLTLYTSGSTAAPKGALLTPRAILSNSMTYRLTHGLDESMVALAASPLAHVAALATGIINPMTVGGRTVVMSTWRPEAGIQLIEQERVTHFGTVVTYLQDIVELYEKGDGGDHRIRIVSVGGAPTPPTLIHRADAIGIGAINQYGMTEVACNSTLGRPDHPLERRAVNSGRVVYGTEIQAVDEDRRALPPGEVGELRIRSPQLMLGYTSPQATAECMDEDGWFYTGDVGSVDGEGWLRIHGRIKDIINRGGEKFSAQDIEIALAGFPGIAAVAAVGAPDARFGEVVAAFVKLAPDAEWAGPEPLLAHLETLRMARSKFPVIWRVVDQFPVTAAGKIQKQALRDQLKAEMLV